MDNFSGLGLKYDEAVYNTIDIHKDILSSLNPDNNSNRQPLTENIIEIRNVNRLDVNDPPALTAPGGNWRQSECNEIKRTKIGHIEIGNIENRCTENGAIADKPQNISLNTSGYTRKQAHQLITQVEDDIERIRKDISAFIKTRNDLKDTIREQKKIYNELNNKHTVDINFQKDLRLFPSNELKQKHIISLVAAQKKEQDHQARKMKELKASIVKVANPLKTLHQQLAVARQRKLQIGCILQDIIQNDKKAVLKKS